MRARAPLDRTVACALIAWAQAIRLRAVGDDVFVWGTEEGVYVEGARARRVFRATVLKVTLR